MKNAPANDDPQSPALTFVTTRRTVVLRAGGEAADSGAALEQLCRDYWYPLYAFARRRRLAVHDAQDSTQAFFLHLMEGGMLKRADAERGRFRTLLLGAMQNFLANEYRAQHRLKRGGGASFIALDALDAEGRFALEPTDPMTGETQYNRSWAFALLERVFRRLGAEYEAAGRADLFEKIRPFLAAESARPGYPALAEKLGLSAGTVRDGGYSTRTRSACRGHRGHRRHVGANRCRS